MATIWDNNGRVAFKTNHKEIIKYLLQNFKYTQQNGAYRFEENSAITMSGRVDFEFHIYYGYIMTV